MSTLEALQQAEAFTAGRALPKTTLRHVHLDDAPLVVSLHVLAGEPFAALGIVWGTDPDRPAGYTVVPEPRNRDLRYAGLTAFGQDLSAYLGEHLTYTTRPGSGGTTITECGSAPQIIVPDKAAANALVLMAGRGVLRSPTAPPIARQAAAHLTMLGQHRDRPGQSLFVAATELLGMHFDTGQADIENQNLAANLAWIDPDPAHTSRTGRLTAIAAAEHRTWGPLRSPDADRELAALISTYHRARDDHRRDLAVQAITAAVLPELVAAYHGTHHALTIMRPMNLAPSADLRRTEDRSAWAWHARRFVTSGGEPLFRARDSAETAQRTVARLEPQVDRLTSQMAYDDPLVMGYHVDAGRAFTGVVTAVDQTNRERRPGGVNRVRVPIITVRTPSRPRFTTGTAVWCLTGPGRHGIIGTSIRTVRRATHEPGDDPEDTPYLVELTVVSGMNRPMPAPGRRYTFAGFGVGAHIPAPPARPVPWTHQPA